MLVSEQKEGAAAGLPRTGDIPAKLQYQLAGIQHLELYGQNEQQVLEDLAKGLAKRGVSREGEAAATQSTTVKRHERPRPKHATLTQPNNLARPIAWALAVCVVALLGLLLFKTPTTESPTAVVQNQSPELGRVHLKIPIPEEYPMAKPTDMPFGVAMRMLAISPNGKHLAYVCMREKERHLCLRSLSDDTFQLLKAPTGRFFRFSVRTDNGWAF